MASRSTSIGGTQHDHPDAGAVPRAWPGLGGRLAGWRNEDPSKAAKSVRATLEGFARHGSWQDASEAELSGLLFHIFTAGLPWWRRLRLARGHT